MGLWYLEAIKVESILKYNRWTLTLVGIFYLDIIWNISVEQYVQSINWNTYKYLHDNLSLNFYNLC